MTAPTRLDARATDRALATPGSPEVTRFYDEDTNVFSPKELMSTLQPPPDLVTYQ